MAQVLRIVLSLTGEPEFEKSEAHVVTELCDLHNEELVQMVGRVGEQRVQKVETVVAVRDTLSAPRPSPRPTDNTHAAPN
eukprot:SAG25_NODE_19_length_23408_cov_10.997040_9_plen_80_part_00